MLDLLQTSEAINGYTVRAWTGIATDEGVGLISTVEVSDSRGVPVCRFEEFVPDWLRLTAAEWPKDQDEAARTLQERALERARSAILSDRLRDTHLHRFDATTTSAAG